MRRSSAHDIPQPGALGSRPTHPAGPGIRPSLFRRTAAVLIVLLLLSACGGGEDSPQATPSPAGGESIAAENTATAAPPPTAEPSATAQPSPTTPPTPTTAPTATAELAAGFRSLDYGTLGISLSVPDDWHAETTGELVLLASAENLIDDTDFAQEGAVMAIAAGDTAEMEDTMNTRDPLIALSASFEDMGFGQETKLVQGPTAATIAGLPAATARYEAISDTDIPLSGVMVVIVGENRSAVAFGATPKVWAKEYVPVMEAIAGSIELSQKVAAVQTDQPPLSIDGTLLAGDTVSGLLAAGGRSAWLFNSLPGETYDIVVDPLSEDLDVVVDVLDESGESLLGGGAVDESFDEEELYDLQFENEGPHTLVVEGYEPEMSGEFEISFTLAQPGGEPPGAQSQAGITYGAALTAAFDGASDTLQFPFDGQEGDIAQFVVTPQGDLDIVVDIVDANGSSLVPAGRDNHGSGAEIAGARLPADGTYTLVVSTYYGETEGEIEVKPVGPGGTEISAADAFEEDGEDHAFPFSAVAGDVVGLYLQPDGGLETELAVYDAETDSELVRLVRSSGEKGLGFEAAQDGEYYFLITGFGSGAYEAALLGSENVYYELAAGDHARGRFPDVAYGITYQYFGEEGETIVVTVQTDEEADAVIEVYDEDDNQVEYVDETLFGEPEVLTYTFDAEGLIYIDITELDFAAGIFELTFERG